ncbi:MAG: hypothetical protein WCH11_06495 [Bdellovibrio sp.]
MTQKFHKFYLKISAILVASFGPICFLGSIPGFSEPARWTLDLLSWPIDGMQVYDPTTRFMSAILGGFLFGFGVMIWCLSIWVYDKAPDAVRKSVVVGLCSWFVLDSAGSILSGNASNAFFNVFILIAFVGPLWVPVKDSE